VIRPRGREIAGRHDRHPREGPQLDSLLLASSAQPTLARPRVGADVVAQKDGGRTSLRRDRERLLDDVSSSERERAPARGERGAQIAERVEEERDPVGHAEALEHDWIEHEQRHDLVGLASGGRERRLVVEAEVTREEDDGSGHGRNRYRSR